MRPERVRGSVAQVGLAAHPRLRLEYRRARARGRRRQQPPHAYEKSRTDVESRQLAVSPARKAPDRDAPPMYPVTYFPVETRRRFAKNRELVRGKPYERHFNGDLWLHEDVLPAIRAPMAARDALGVEDVDALLDPGYHPVENGYCELADGTAYVASRVSFPGCTGDMYRWWFWWHSVESARYTLWYPHNHVACRPIGLDALMRPGLSHEQRYVGSTHEVDEYIGPERLEVAIRFVDPAELGFDTSRFAEAGIVGHACARVGLRRAHLEAVTMVHLARKTDEGIEQRSRYLDRPRPPCCASSGATLRSTGSGSMFGVKRRMAGERVAYEQLLHDQIEFTHPLDVPGGPLRRVRLTRRERGQTRGHSGVPKQACALTSSAKTTSRSGSAAGDIGSSATRRDRRGSSRTVHGAVLAM